MNQEVTISDYKGPERRSAHYECLICCSLQTSLKDLKEDVEEEKMKTYDRFKFIVASIILLVPCMLSGVWGIAEIYKGVALNRSSALVLTEAVRGLENKYDSSRIREQSTREELLRHFGDH
jgi:hypothetical protein